MTFAGGMTDDWYHWLAQSLVSASPAELGIVRTDATGRLIDRLTISGANVLRLELPALDAGAAAPALFRVSIEGGIGQLQAASGLAPASLIASRTTAKVPMSNLFRLELSGLGNPPVASIGAVSIERVPPQVQRGGTRLRAEVPLPPQVADISLIVPDNAAGPLFQWYMAMVIQGNISADAERQGTLTYLARDATDPIGSVTLHGLGITGFERIVVGKLPFVKVAIYCEGLELDLAGMAM